MSDIAITASGVVAGTGAEIDRGGLAGETVTAGQVVYRKSTDGRWWLAQHDGTAEESGVGVQVGVCLHGSLAGQPVAVQTGGLITIGATIAAGVVYYLSAGAGGIAPIADIGSADRVTIIGYGTTTAIMQLLLRATNTVLA
jgi:hypothetical protein